MKTIFLALSLLQHFSLLPKIKLVVYISLSQTQLLLWIGNKNHINCYRKKKHGAKINDSYMDF